MFGIDQRIINHIAQVEVQHSELLPWMKLPEEEADLMECRLAEWLEKQTSPEAARIVRESVFFLIEREAIQRYVEKYPQMAGYLPEIQDAREAAELGAREIMYASPKAKEEAVELLESLLKKEVTLPTEEI